MKSTACVWLIAAVASASGCAKNETAGYQGYVEAEYVHVAPGAGGRLERLFVKRGQTVEVNAPLFQLEASEDTAAVHHADENAAAARAQLADLKTGKRGPEIDVIRAQRDQAVLAELQSAADLARDQAQFDAGGIPRAQVDATRTRHEVDVARVRELTGQLVVAEQAARPEQLQAQASQIAAADAVREQARTKLNEKRLVARQPGVIVDTLFSEGEWVPPGAPVVRMLPINNIKLRFFIPEPVLAQFPVGTKIAIHCDGCPADLVAEVTYVSTEPEFTPPIIYSNDTRAKLVFMIEARPSAAAAPALRPGQPVTITHVTR